MLATTTCLVVLASLATSTTAKANSTATHEPDFRGWTSAPNLRGTTDILWSCLSAIFLCVYASLHLNVRANGERDWRIYVRKAKWAALSVVAPEIMVLYASSQLFEVSNFTWQLNGLGYGWWTITHSFAVRMGAIQLEVANAATSSSAVVKTNVRVLNLWMFSDVIRLAGPHRHESSGPSNLETEIPLESDPVQVDTQLFVGSEPLSSLSEPRLFEDIKDKSKSNNLIKCVAVLQTGWLVVQCIARRAQHLPISSFEIASIAYCSNGVSIYIFWWHKPLDIDRPVIIEARHVRKPWVATAPLNTLEVEMFHSWRWRERLRLQNWTISLPFIFVKSSLVEALIKKKSSTFRSIKLKLWQWSVWNFRRKGNSVDIDPAIGISLCAAVLFSGIHLFAWNSTFASFPEKLLWRICSALTTGLPILGLAMNLVQMQAETRNLSKVVGSFIGLLALIAIAYTISRGFLIVEPIVGLRYLPIAAYDTVDWTGFIPHVN
jgi:hypothetical protein